ncbi:MAG TPA: RNA polymerase sigma factor [Polyangia bacterium]|jgi:RNA polymerase sigma-70 factor (ECF subfamily)|nr:RNA polymerase sigma factor [Polyangia bacterium]
MKQRPHTRLAPVTPVAADAAVDEALLVAALGGGDLAALATAFDRWHQRVRVLARRLLSDPAAAEDVVQDVFTALPRAVGRFRGEVDLETFLLGIAVKRVRRHRRAAQRRLRALERMRALDRRGPVDPEQDTYRRELGARLAAALDELPLPQRVAFVLCEVEELTSVQAALVARAPEATIRTRLFHARRRLRDLLAGEQIR